MSDLALHRVGLDITMDAVHFQSPGLFDWCPDEDTCHNVVARRNVLLALWAGRRMGLSGDRLSAYAVAVHQSDFELTGDADILAKVTGDLRRSGLPVQRSQVEAELRASHRTALRQTHITD
jgi:hypothetical protein